MMTGDPDILDTLKAVVDPEIGINIVDLGLVYGAERNTAGIAVALTMTSRFCPLAETVLDEVEETLRQRFRETPSIRVALTFEPPWSPDRISEDGRHALGWAALPRRRRLHG